MLSLLSSRETGVSSPLYLRRAESTRRTYSLELSKYQDLQKIYDAGVNSIDLDPVENRYLLSGAGNGMIGIHDLHNCSGTPQQTYPAVCTVGRSNRSCHKYAIGTVQWYPVDTGMFVSTAMDKVMKVWDANTLKCADEFEFSQNIYSHHISTIATKHCLVAVGTKSSNAKLVDLKAGSKMHTLRGHRGAVMTVKWSTKNEFLLATGSEDNKIMIWDIRSAKGSMQILDQHNGDSTASPNSVNTAHSGAVNGLCFTADGLHLLSFGTDDNVRLWDVSTGRNTLVNYGKLFNDSKRCVHMTVSENTDPEVLFVPVDNNIEAFDILSGTKLLTLRGHYNSVNDCLFNNDSHELYSCGNDRNILMWLPDTETVKAYGDHLKGKSTEPKQQNFMKRIAATQDAWSSDED